jgi:MFS family permease
MEPSEVASTPRWLTPGVAGIGLASFLADTGHEIPTALLPDLIRGLGASASMLGVIEGIADGLAGTARLIGGALADDPGRRQRVAVGGYTSTAALAAATGAATGVWQVGVLRAGAWGSRGLRVPARNALLADLVPAEVYGRAYGFERAMDNLGAIAGPLLALGLVSAVGTRTAIGLSVIPGLLAALAIVYAIRHAPRLEQHDRRPVRIKIRPVLRAGLGRLFAGVAAFEIANVSTTLLILRATELLQPGRSHHRATQLAIAGYVAYNLAATLISIPAGRLGDRRSPRLILIAGILLFAVAYLGFATHGGLILVVAAFVAAGLAIGCVETAQHAAVASAAPAELRGSAFGLLAGIQAGGNLLASAIAGVLWTAVSPTAAFAYLAACSLAAAALLAADLRRS